MFANLQVGKVDLSPPQRNKDSGNNEAAGFHLLSVGFGTTEVEQGTGTFPTCKLLTYEFELKTEQL